MIQTGMENLGQQMQYNYGDNSQKYQKIVPKKMHLREDKKEIKVEYQEKEKNFIIE